MDRRKFIAAGFAGVGGLALGGIGLAWGRDRARAAAVSGMLDDALPPLEAKAVEELNTLPAKAREEIKRYFHGKCLNVHGFFQRVTSDDFRELLDRCGSDSERDACFQRAFCDRVAAADEIVHRVEVSAIELGAEIDARWAACCASLAGKWGRRLGSREAFLPTDLSWRAEALIREQIQHAANWGKTPDSVPLLGSTLGKLGQDAIRLLPMSRVQAGPRGVDVNVLALPTFCLLGAKHCWQHLRDLIFGRPGDDRAGIQTAVSARVALLGLRVGVEFEREVRRRLSDLHGWQGLSVRRTAAALAQERIGLL